MNLEHTQTNSAQPLLDMLDAGIPIAITAPLLLEDQLLIGYYSPSAESSGCAVIPRQMLSDLAECVMSLRPAP
jgi:hypothetical protein